MNGGFPGGLLNAGNVISRYSSVFLILAAVLIGCILFSVLREKGHSQLRKMAVHLPFFREIPVAMDYSRLTQGLSPGTSERTFPGNQPGAYKGSDLTAGDTRKTPEGFLYPG